MMTCMTTCQICQKTIEECREADKQLITPYDPRNNIKTIDFFSDNHRLSAVCKYVLGCYDLDTNITYDFGDHITYRQLDDVMLSVPFCVYECDTDLFDIVLSSVIKDNIDKLPISKKHHKLLIKLINNI